MQGDVLKRTPELESVLKQIHPHFFENEKNTHFMVLTQSCDLYIRQDGKFSAPYITIAPVRSLDYLVKKKISEDAIEFPDTGIAIATEKYKTKFCDYLQRLFNNNEKGFFFLESSPIHSLPDSCAILKLSISLKAQEHYSVCQKAKILQLKDTFQGKLGWLIGDIYSRIGTDDWEAKLLSKKIKSTVESLPVVWVPTEKSKEVKAGIIKTQQDQGHTDLKPEIILDMVNKIPTKKSKFNARTQEILDEVLGDEDEAKTRIKKLLRNKFQNDVLISTLFN